MKRCPECRRDYYDDTLLYCLDDGNALFEGPASAGGSANEPATTILPERLRQQAASSMNRQRLGSLGQRWPK